MQFKVAADPYAVDLSAVENALKLADPAAVVDFDPAGDHLRISTFMSALEVLECVDGAGVAVSRDQIEQLPSECCGGCGG